MYIIIIRTHTHTRVTRNLFLCAFNIFVVRRKRMGIPVIYIIFAGRYVSYIRMSLLVYPKKKKITE